MRILTGLLNFTVGFVVMMLGILIGFTIIGLLFAFPIATAGVAKMAQGMAQMGFGSVEAANKLRGPK